MRIPLSTYNEVELEKEVTVKKYLTIGRIGGSNLCIKFTSSNKNVHFLHVNGLKKHAIDCREQNRGEGCDGQGRGEPD